MTYTDNPIDCIYVAASARDARYTRICIASIRYFYPEVPIRLLVGGRLQRGLENELRYWDVQKADLPASGDYGWGFVKLEPLFVLPGEKFLVLDSDTVLAGPVLDARKASDAPFLVDEEKQSQADTARLYYDWEKVRNIDPSAQPPVFVFNSGQWFGTAGILSRDDFAPWMEWTMPRKLRHPECFRCGDQGILNYVLNQKVTFDKVFVDRKKIMRWPGHAMDGLDVESVAKRAAAPLVVHWAGMKTLRQRSMVGADLLAYFERVYYQRLPAGRARRFLAAYRDVLSQSLFGAKVWVKLASRKLAGVRRAPAPG